MTASLLSRTRLVWLLEFLNAVPEEPLGAHLPDERLEEYSREQLPAPIVEAMDQHLASCEDCAERLEWLLSFRDVLTKEAERRRASPRPLTASRGL
jgi:anti-sigma factor RsiW